MKLSGRSVILVLICVGLWVACTDERSKHTGDFIEIEGRTMGTTYSCKASIGDIDHIVLKKGIDSLLDLINQATSTYIPLSIVSSFNSADDSLCLPSNDPALRHFNHVFTMSGVMNEMTGGYFDPTVMPLVNYWGFGYEESRERESIDTAVIDSLLRLTGLEKVQSHSSSGRYCIIKEHPAIELDFSANAKGYAVDEIAGFLSSRGAKSVYVNIGGEIVVKGPNPKGQPWKLGVNYPDTTSGLKDLYATVQVGDGAMATSGNYRNFYTAKGQFYSHTIDPSTGLATPSDLLSATILAPNCASADAIATACMAMGYERAKALTDSIDEIQALLIYRSEDGQKLQHALSHSLEMELIKY